MYDSGAAQRTADWLQLVRAAPYELIHAIADWWEITCDLMHDVQDGAELLEVPQQYRTLTWLLSAWCDDGSGIDPTPITLLYRRFEARNRSVRVFGGTHADRDFYRPVGEMKGAFEAAWILKDRIASVASLRYHQWQQRGQMPPNLTPNQQDVWRAVVEAGHRMTKDAIARALAQKNGAEPSDGMLKQDLALFTQRLRVWDNTSGQTDRPEPRGYGYPWWP